MWKIKELRFKIDEKIDLPLKIANIFMISKKDIISWEILKKSIDARNKDNIYITFTLKADLRSDLIIDLNKIEYKKISKIEKKTESREIIRKRLHSTNPVIVGTGPSGLFCALKLIEKGYKPVVLERGNIIKQRIRDVNKLWNERQLNIESNVQFGEGGAGTFSDGKLVCRKKNPEIKDILNTFVKFGAPKEILYENKPHVGTDKIRKTVTNIKNYLKDKGATFYFSTKLTDIKVKNKHLLAILNNKETCETDSIILAIGHSSTETYKMLYKNNILMEPKGFAMGLRIEHSQELIDRAQYGKFTGHHLLTRADYLLRYKDITSGRGVYSFCMCPGGTVVCASSEEEKLVINGMSNYKRDSGIANSAIVVSLSVDDFYKNSPLDGIIFQRKYEEKAYKMGGGNYNAPFERTASFLNKKKVPTCNSTYLPGLKESRLENCLPDFLISPLKNGLTNFCRKIKGFERSILIGIESRTTSPVRIVRSPETRDSLNTKGLYPVGEGAGYAGGITSSALDGIKTADVF